MKEQFGSYYDPCVDMLLSYYRVLSDWNYKNLRAPYWRLYWNDSSGAALQTAQGLIQLQPQSMYLIPPNFAYDGVLYKPVKHFYCHFLTGLPYRTDSLDVVQFEAPVAITSRLEQYLQAGIDSDPIPIRLALLGRAAVLYGLCHLPEPFLQDKSDTDPRIASVLETMARNYNQNLSNGELATLVHMNTNAFIRRFRQMTGSSPQGHLAQIRIDRACIFLHHTDKTIEQVAKDTGFCDRYHFSRVFQKFMGIGPAGFRKKRNWPVGSH